MNGKMRAGIMFRMAPLPKTNRKIVARLPVQKAIGSPSMSRRPSEPKRSSDSHWIGISRPISDGLSAGHDQDVLYQLGYALQDDERRAERNGELHRPVLHAPLGERGLAVLHGVPGELPAGEQQGDGEDEKEHRGDDVGDRLAARREV